MPNTSYRILVKLVFGVGGFNSIRSILDTLANPSEMVFGEGGFMLVKR